MLSRLGFNRRRETDKALAELETWTVSTWRDHWDRSDQDDLQAALDSFLPFGMSHAKAQPDLRGIYSARLTRTLLLGITNSQTHDAQDLEAALGVPMPEGTIR